VQLKDSQAVRVCFRFFTVRSGAIASKLAPTGVLRLPWFLSTPRNLWERGLPAMNDDAVQLKDSQAVRVCFRFFTVRSGAIASKLAPTGFDGCRGF